MPEGDTIHRAARRIDAALGGSIPDEVLTPHPRHRFDHWPERLGGRTLLGAEARGKHLLLHFEGELALHSHLRMTGLWGIAPTGTRWRRSPRRAWLVLRGAGYDVVEFDGPLLELLTETRVRTHPQLAALGQDVIGESFDDRAFIARLREDDPTRGFGDALLDQHNLAGIGNLWKSETCFAVALDPWRRLADISDQEALAASAFARERMSQAVREGVGSRPRSVYRRAGLPCPRCGTPISERGQGDNNRLTYWCAGCQR